MRVPFYLVQLLDGFETTTDSVQGMLTSYMENAGFEKVEEVRQISILLERFHVIKPRNYECDFFK